MNISDRVMMTRIFGAVLWEIEQSRKPISRQALVTFVQQHALRVARSAEHPHPANLCRDIELYLTELFRVLDARLENWPPSPSEQH